MASHATLLMYDATEGLTRADKQVASLAIEHGKSCVIVPNKCDLLGDVEREAIARDFAEGLPMLWYAPLVPSSVHTGEGLERALDLVAEAAEWRQVRVPHRRLNELFQRAQLLRPLPKVRALKDSQAGRIRILYVLQARTEVPTFVIHLNRQVELHRSDQRWIENTIRSQWAFTATPLRLIFRSRDVRKRRRDRETLRRGPTRSKRARARREYEAAPYGHAGDGQQPAIRLAVGRHGLFDDGRSR